MSKYWVTIVTINWSSTSTADTVWHSRSGQMWTIQGPYSTCSPKFTKVVLLVRVLKKFASVVHTYKHRLSGVDFLISQIRFYWYKKIEFLISINRICDINKSMLFWYHKFDLLISKNRISWYQEMIFWYQEMNLWYQKWYCDIRKWILDIKKIEFVISKKYWINSKTAPQKCL